MSCIGKVWHFPQIEDEIKDDWFNQVNERCSPLAFGVADLGLSDRTMLISSIFPSFSSTIYIP